ncbi:MAG: hypothetical protein Q7S40_07075 [Opitutaceae bacterium]|nr:hypothetical protein [Opitutaceae bacterium]
MKKNRIVLAVGVLVSALFLSGCMAAMMPAMLLGHAAFGKIGGSHGHGSAGGKPTKPCECERPSAAIPDGQAAEGASHEQTAKPCDCQKPAEVKTDAQATSAAAPSSGHKH